MDTLQQKIDRAKRIVFFGGAGVSTESGIPDFRSVDGLYNQKYDYPPETILHADFFFHWPAEFYRFYCDKMIGFDAKPNAAHLKLAELEAAGKLTAVVTQNIDGLHQAAGSKTVYELHGSTLRNYCLRCGKFHDIEHIRAAGRGALGADGLPADGGKGDGVPRCSCGGMVKPDVVLYGEGLDNDVMMGAIEAIQQADLLMVGGTSLAVYPAAGLLRYFRGSELVLLNKQPTPYDDRATLILRGKIGEELSAIEVK